MQCNRSEIAEVFGVVPGTIDLMVKKGMPFISKPNGSKGMWAFDSRRCIDWYAKEQSDGLAKESEKAKVQMRREVAEVTIAEVKAAAALRSVVLVSDAVRIFEEKASVVKSLVRAMPGRVAAAVAAESDPAKVLVILKTEVNSALSGITNPKLKEAVADLVKEGSTGEDSLPAPVLVGPSEPEAPAPAPSGGLDYDGY